MSLDLSASFVGSDGSIEAVEEWRVVPDTNGKYEASNLGRLRNTGKQQVRTLQSTPKGYQCIMYRDGGKFKHLYAHRAVLSAFAPVEGWESLTVNHRNFDVKDNSLTNLEWKTKAENVEYSRQRGRYLEANKAHSALMKERYNNKSNPLATLTRASIEKMAESQRKRHAARKLKQAA